MTAGDWTLLLLVGGLAGIIGQGIRAVVGLKKTHDLATALDRSFSQVFEPNRLLVSLLIGFIAGGLAALAEAPDSGTMTITKKMIIGMVTAGYAGTDFISGFMKKAPSASAVARGHV